MADCARDEGREEEKIATIKKYFQKNMPIEDIVFFTGYSEEQINQHKLNIYRPPCTAYRVSCTVYRPPCTAHRVPYSQLLVFSF